MKLSALQSRRIQNFRANRRALKSLWIFGILFFLSLFAEVIANERPLVVSYQGNIHFPIFKTYTDMQFGGDFLTEAEYRDQDMKCLIRTGGLEACFDDPMKVYEDAADGVVDGVNIDKGWMLWPLIPYKFNTVDTLNVETAPGAPNLHHWLGTDDQARDVGARII